MRTVNTSAELCHCPGQAPVTFHGGGVAAEKAADCGSCLTTKYLCAKLHTLPVPQFPLLQNEIQSYADGVLAIQQNLTEQGPLSLAVVWSTGLE